MLCVVRPHRRPMQRIDVAYCCRCLTLRGLLVCVMGTRMDLVKKRNNRSQWDILIILCARLSYLQWHCLYGRYAANIYTYCY